MMPWPGYVRGSKGQILQNIGDLANFLLPKSSDAARAYSHKLAQAWYFSRTFPLRLFPLRLYPFPLSLLRPLEVVGKQKECGL